MHSIEDDIFNELEIHSDNINFELSEDTEINGDLLLKKYTNFSDSSDEDIEINGDLLLDKDISFYDFSDSNDEDIEINRDLLLEKYTNDSNDSGQLVYNFGGIYNQENPEEDLNDLVLFDEQFLSEDGFIPLFSNILSCREIVSPSASEFNPTKSDAKRIVYYLDSEKRKRRAIEMRIGLLSTRIVAECIGIRMEDLYSLYRSNTSLVRYDKKGSRCVRFSILINLAQSESYPYMKFYVNRDKRDAFFSIGIEKERFFKHFEWFLRMSKVAVKSVPLWFLKNFRIKKRYTSLSRGEHFIVYESRDFVNLFRISKIVDKYRRY
jgi:hypothetical protein